MCLAAVVSTHSTSFKSWKWKCCIPHTLSFGLKPSLGKKDGASVPDTTWDHKCLPFTGEILLNQAFCMFPLLDSWTALKQWTRMAHKSTGEIGGCGGKFRGPLPSCLPWVSWFLFHWRPPVPFTAEWDHATHFTGLLWRLDEIIVGGPPKSELNVASCYWSGTTGRTQETWNVALTWFPHLQILLLPGYSLLQVTKLCHTHNFIWLFQDIIFNLELRARKHREV